MNNFRKDNGLEVSNEESFEASPNNAFILSLHRHHHKLANTTTLSDINNDLSVKKLLLSSNATTSSTRKAVVNAHNNNKKSDPSTVSSRSVQNFATKNIKTDDTKTNSSSKLDPLGSASDEAQVPDKVVPGLVSPDISDSKLSGGSSSESSGTGSKKMQKHGQQIEIVDPKKEWTAFYPLMVLLPVAILVSIVFEIYHKKYADMDFAIPIEYPTELDRLSLTQFFSGAGGWITGFMWEPEGIKKRWGMFFFLMGGIFFGQWIEFQFVLWMGRWYDLLQFPKENFHAFLPLFSNFLIIVSVQILFGVYEQYYYYNNS